jgi:hypothetical protein
MLSKHEEQRERRETLLNDQRVREQGSTFHQFAEADARTPRGRFSAVDAATVVGAQPTVNYPAAAAHQHDPCGQEPPTGYCTDAMPELEATSSAPERSKTTSMICGSEGAPSIAPGLAKGNA